MGILSMQVHYKLQFSEPSSCCCCVVGCCCMDFTRLVFLLGRNDEKADSRLSQSWVKSG